AVEARLDLLGADLGRKLDGPREVADAQLAAQVLPVLGRRLLAVARDDVEHPVVERDLDVLGLEAGDRRLHLVRVAGVDDVQRQVPRRGLAACLVRVHGVSPEEITEKTVHGGVQAGQLTDRGPTIDRHLAYPPSRAPFGGRKLLIRCAITRTARGLNRVGPRACEARDPARISTRLAA